MPVDVLSDIIPGPAARSKAPGSTYFVTGQTERGPIDEAIKVQSLADYEYHFGSRVSFGFLRDDLEAFFQEGGAKAYVGRVVGATPVVSTLTLEDRAGAPLDTVRIDAKDPGVWGDDLTVTVADGTDANTVKITISGTPDGVDEVFDNLATPAAIETTLTAESRWVDAEDLGSATAAPNNRPAVSAAAPLADGDDDRGTVVSADYSDAADTLFGKELGAGAVAVPGLASSAVGTALIAHAKANDRIAILTPAVAQSPTQAVAAGAALAAVSGIESSEMMYPWVIAPDGAGGVRTIPPTGYTAAKRAIAHETIGPEKAHAGAISQARFILGVERELTRAENDTLDAGRVNAIRTIAGGVRIQGARSLSPDLANWRFITYRDVMNDIEVECETALLAYEFRLIDGRNQAFSDLAGELIGIAGRYASRDALFPKRNLDTGEEIDPGYAADTGPGVNTPATIEAGEIHGKLAVRPSPTGALVVVTVSKAAFTATL